MGKLFKVTDIILNNPYANMFLALVFLYTSIDGLIENYKSDIKGVSIHHSIALYGFVMFIRSLLTAVKAINGLEKVKDQLKKPMAGNPGNSENQS